MSGPQILIGNTADILHILRNDLQLSPDSVTNDDIALIASVLRRLSGFMCPCPRNALVAAARRALVPLKCAEESSSAQITDVLEDLLVCGDLIELSKVAIAGSDENPTWVFCGPLSFLEIQNRIYLFGVAPDDAVYLPSSLQSRMVCNGSTRYLEEFEDDDIGEILESIGLRRLTESTWLSNLPSEEPANFINKIQTRLYREGAKGSRSDILILRHADGQRLSYKERWKPFDGKEGLFIGRGEQEYGAPLWYILESSGGQVQQSHVLPFHDIAGRACDNAWRIQLAMDAIGGHSATYTMVEEEGGYRVNTSFPLPLVAQRRMLYLGGLRNHETRYDRSFWIPQAASVVAESFLQSALWLSKSES